MRPATDERILRATYELLRESGYSALTVERVAERSGVAKTTIYRGYRNRADLATAALAAYDTDVEAAEAQEGIRDALHAALVALGDKLEAVGVEIIGTMLAASEDDELRRLHRERIVVPHSEALAARIAEAQESGELRRDFHPRLAIEMAVGSFFARHVAGRELPVERWADEVIDLLWRGVGAPAGASAAARSAGSAAR